MTEAMEDQIVTETIEECAKLAETIVLANKNTDYSKANELPEVAYELGRRDEAITIAASLRNVMKDK